MAHIHTHARARAHAKVLFLIFSISYLKSCNHKTSIKRGGSIYLNDHAKIKDQSLRCYRHTTTASYSTQPCVAVYCCYILLQATMTLLHVAGLCSIDY